MWEAGLPSERVTELPRARGAGRPRTVRAPGIEPGSAPYKEAALPLSYARLSGRRSACHHALAIRAQERRE